MRYFAGRQLKDRYLHILLDLAELKGLQIYNKPVGIFISVITPNSAYQTCHPEAQAELFGICACVKPRDLYLYAIWWLVRVSLVVAFDFFASKFWDTR